MGQMLNTTHTLMEKFSRITDDRLDELQRTFSEGIREVENVIQDHHMLTARMDALETQVKSLENSLEEQRDEMPTGGLRQ